MKKRPSFKTAFFTTLAVLLAMTSILALKSPEKEICKDDIQHYCSRISNERSIYKCLVKNYRDLSYACQSELDSYKKNIENYTAACSHDLQQFCSGLTFKNWSQSLQCLSEHQSELTDECRYHFELQSWLHEPDRTLIRD